MVIEPGIVMAGVAAARCRFAALPTPISIEPLMSQAMPAASATAATRFARNSPPGLV